MSRHLRTSPALIVSMLGLLAPTAGHARDPLEVSAGATLTYDSNVWRLSDEDKDLYEELPDLPFFSGVDNVSDWILSPYIAAEYKIGWPRTGSRFRVELNGEAYARNNALSYVGGRLELRTPLTAATDAALSLSHRPDLYVGETRTTTDPLKTDKEFVTQNGIGLDVEHKPNRRALIRLSVEMTDNDFTTGFDEQDGTRWMTGLSATYRVSERLRLRGRYRHERTNAGERLGEDPYAAPGEMPSLVVTNDISSVRDTWDASVSYRVRRAAWVTARYRVDFKHYTTASIADLNHYQREDATRRIELGVSRLVGRRWIVGASAAHSERTTNNDATIYAYSADSVSLDVNYLF
jgi:hypothetical protein